MTRPRSKHPLRCFCARKPLLGVYGIDERGRLYVHVRVYRQNRLYTDIVVNSGDMKICCRECYRWHSIVFRDNQRAAELVETTTPAEIEESFSSHDTKSDREGGT